MHFISTRGNKEKVIASKAIIKGICDDGGLYVPTYFPNLKDKLNNLVNLSYKKLCFEVLKLFLDDFNEKELSEELIKQQDLFFLSNDQLRLLRNAFYAIHGYDFKSQDLKEYFSGFSWYKPNPNFSESDFTEIERKNIELIRQMENQEETIY